MKTYFYYISISKAVISLFFTFIILHIGLPLYGQTSSPFRDYSQVKKRVYNFTKVEFITEEGEFNESICTLVIPDLKEDSPPYVAIYYKRSNSEWFTESLYRKRVRFSFKDGVIKLDRTNFWDWFELEEIKVVVIY